MKEKGREWAALTQMKPSRMAVFASKLETAASSVYRFLKGLEAEKKVESAGNKMLGGYNVKTNEAIDQEKIVMIGKLPPREILLAQLLGMIAAPIKSLLYILDQRSKKTPTP